jgi:glycine cleavage system aminomethyltransferase T
MSTNDSEMSFAHIEAIPYNPGVFAYNSWGGMLVPYEYTGWEDETLSWKENCYLHGNLSGCMPGVKVTGPDAKKMLSHIAVNSLEKFPIGTAKHTIMCNEKGNILEHGMTLHVGEDEFECYSFNFYLEYLYSTGKYNIEKIETRYDNFCFQVAGPRSLEVVEQAIQEDIHDLKFMRFMDAKIAGHKVRILRMGMGGTLCYEVHGPNKISHDVYNEILRVGESYGIRKLGYLSFMCNHTENGFPQTFMHFLNAWAEDERLSHGATDAVFENTWNFLSAVPKGSWSKDIKDYFRNPIELGWGHMVKFDHDFIGRKALEKIIANNPRKMVTLRWNPEDILEVYASNFKKGEEPYKIMEFPQNFRENETGNLQDRVLKNGKVIGVSMGRLYTKYYRDVISQCCIDPEYAKAGTEVAVVWGDIGKRQKEIRATVERFPYLDLAQNKDFDIDSIPHFKK